MKTIKVKNTKDVRLAGVPSENVISLGNTEYLALCPALVPFVKPRLMVEKGDMVKIGTPIFFDKKDKNVIFVSPVSGEVKDIVYGNKRVIKNLIIKCDDNEKYHTFEAIDIDKTDINGLKKAIIDGGLWGNFRIFPFLGIPKSDESLPEDIYISIDEDEPHFPKSKIYLKDRLDEFNLGIKAIKKLFKNVHIAVGSKNDEVKNTLKDTITHTLSGYYPANNAGVFLYNDKTNVKQNESCTINPQNIIKLGYLLKNGKYLNTKIITISGSMLSNPTHALVNDGTSIKDILANENLSGDYRVIAGGVFRGRTTDMNDYIGANEYAVHILSNELKQDIFPFMKLGFNKHTSSRAYFSFLLPKKELKLDTSLHGEPRACISCSLCVEACPVELLPQEIMKNLYADRRAEALDLGMLDCVDCGVCTYVCPSNIELADIIDVAKNTLHKELNS